MIANDKEQLGLHKCEVLRKDGYYMFRKRINGELFTFYAKTLEGLREKEEQFFRGGYYDKVNACYRTFSGEEIKQVVKKYQCDSNKAKSFCYFIENGTHVKIGKTNNVQQRLKDLQTENGCRLRLICVIPCKTEEDAYQCEKKLHGKFKLYKVNGEWFNILYRINTLELHEMFSECSANWYIISTLLKMQH